MDEHRHFRVVDGPVARRPLADLGVLVGVVAALHQAADPLPKMP